MGGLATSPFEFDDEEPAKRKRGAGRRGLSERQVHAAPASPAKGNHKGERKKKKSKKPAAPDDRAESELRRLQAMFANIDQNVEMPVW